MSALRRVSLAPFDAAGDRPSLPASRYAARCNAPYEAAACDWVAVYADREHCGNLLYLSGLEPRFEEILLLLGPRNQRILLLGNECYDFAATSPLAGVERCLLQSQSLMGQDRRAKPSMTAALSEAGLKRGDCVGLVGWKMLDPTESGGGTAYMVPYATVIAMQSVVGAASTSDVTALLLDPATGLRARIDADTIAEHEWASQRTSAGVWRVLSGITLGETERDAACRLETAGEPLACNIMISSSGPNQPMQGIASPGGRRLRQGDGMTAAWGIWGSLTARAGLLVEHDEDFLKLAQSFFDGILAWYDTVDIGVSGGEVYASVEAALARGGLRFSLNPGHLIGFEEWLHTPVVPNGQAQIASGMPFQVDIIPAPVPAHWGLNCEDGVVIADDALRAQLRRDHPSVWQRIEARRAHIAATIGVDLRPSILPLGDRQLHLPPFWLRPDHVLVRE